MGKLDNTAHKKAARERENQRADWRKPLLRSPFFQIHYAVPLGLVALLSTCYMLFAFLVFRHHLSSFEAHFLLLLLILSVIYTGFLSVVQREALGKWGVVRGAAAVWGGMVVMLIGILMLLFYLAATVGLL